MALLAIGHGKCAALCTGFREIGMGRHWRLVVTLPLVAAVLMLALPAADARQPNTRPPLSYQAFAYRYRCGMDVYERYLRTFSLQEAVARMYWLDRGDCRVLRFRREADTQDLWPQIRQSLRQGDPGLQGVGTGGGGQASSPGVGGAARRP